MFKTIYKLQTLYERLFSSNIFIDPTTKVNLNNRAKTILWFTKNNIKINKNTKIIDLGSGSGYLSNSINKSFDITPTAVDFSLSAKKLASKLYGIDTKIVDLTKKLPFANNSFDIAYSTEIIEHLVFPDLFLSEVNRILKPKGYLILTTPNLASWYNRIILLLGYQPIFAEVSLNKNDLGLGIIKKYIKNNTASGHLRLYTLPSLKDILKENKFQIITAKGLTLYNLPAVIQITENVFSQIPSFSSDLLIIARRSK